MEITNGGTFAPSEFPSKYSNAKACKYHIASPIRRSRVKLTFLYVDVHNSKCSLDHVSVYDGKRTVSRKRITQFCNGNQGDIVVTSKGRHMTVVFSGNTLNTYRGFHAAVEFI